MTFADRCFPNWGQMLQARGYPSHTTAQGFSVPEIDGNLSLFHKHILHSKMQNPPNCQKQKVSTPCPKPQEGGSVQSHSFAVGGVGGGLQSTGLDEDEPSETLRGEALPMLWFWAPGVFGVNNSNFAHLNHNKVK